MSYNQIASDAAAHERARANVPWQLDKQTTVDTDSSGSHTATVEDAGSYIRFNDPGAVNFTIPADADLPFPINAIIEFEQTGVGVVTVVEATGVTVNSRGGALATAGQFAVAAIRKVAANTWTLTGDIA